MMVGFAALVLAVWLVVTFVLSVLSNTRLKKRWHNVRAFEVTRIARLRMAQCAILKSLWYNVRTDIDLRAGEATADVALGDLQCEKTFSQSFPFFKMVCSEIERSEVKP